MWLVIPVPVQLSNYVVVLVIIYTWLVIICQWLLSITNALHDYDTSIHLERIGFAVIYTIPLPFTFFLSLFFSKNHPRSHSDTTNTLFFSYTYKHTSNNGMFIFTCTNRCNINACWNLIHSSVMIPLDTEWNFNDLVLWIVHQLYLLTIQNSLLFQEVPSPSSSMCFFVFLFFFQFFIVNIV